MWLYSPLLSGAASSSGSSASIGSISSTTTISGKSASKGIISCTTTVSGKSTRKGSINCTTVVSGKSASKGSISSTITVSGFEGEAPEEATGNISSTTVVSGKSASKGSISSTITVLGRSSSSSLTGILSVDIRQLLIDSGVCIETPTADWSVHVSDLPAKPIRAVTVVDAGGLNADPAWLLDYRSIQITVRGKKYTEAYQRMAAVKDVLLGIDAQAFNGDWCCGITSLGDFSFIGNDKNDCPYFTWNCRVILEPADNALTSREPL